MGAVSKRGVGQARSPYYASMPLFVSILVWFSVLFVAYAIGVLIDMLIGTPLSERVKITAHKFIPTHRRHTGNTSVRVPDRWTLHVENSNGRGVVAVPQPLYESLSEGEIIQVSGKRGRLSKKWYLYEASKDH